MNAGEFLLILLADIEVEKLMYNYYLKKLRNAWTMMAPHTHAALEIVSVVNGSAFFKFNNDLVKIEKKDVLIIAPYSKHMLYVEKEQTCELSCVQFDLSAIHTRSNGESYYNMIQELSNLSDREFIKFSGSSIFHDSMKRIIVEMDSKESNYETVVKAEATYLIVNICRTIEQLRRTQDNIGNTYVNHAVEYINESLDQKITLRKVAEEINVSEHYLMHLFKKHTGTTLIKYVNTQRIERSKNLLLHTNDTISDISVSVGMETLQYFSNLFRRQTGMSPVQYRKINQAIDFKRIGEQK